jgi:hypothetical protein
MDIGARLRSLGLERYEAALRENEIDEVLLLCEGGSAGAEVAHPTLQRGQSPAVG